MLLWPACQLPFKAANRQILLHVYVCIVGTGLQVKFLLHAYIDRSPNNQVSRHSSPTFSAPLKAVVDGVEGLPPAGCSLSHREEPVATKQGGGEGVVRGALSLCLLLLDRMFLIVCHLTQVTVVVCSMCFLPTKQCNQVRTPSSCT